MSAASTEPDFLIVGAGAAGGVVAKELARQPNTRRLTEAETAIRQPTVSYGRSARHLLPRGAFARDLPDGERSGPLGG